MATLSTPEWVSQSIRGASPLAWAKGALVGGLLAALYADVVPGMVSVWWNDPGYSHGLLIPPLAIYIAWLRHQETLALPVAPDARGLWLTSLACLQYLVGTLGSELFLTRISMVFLLAGLTWTFWGLPRLWSLAFPLVLLVTMVPIPAIVYNKLAAPLQLFASGISTDLLQLLAIPVYRDGNIIHLSNTTLGVAEACSGLRSISSLTVLALLIGYLQISRLSLRALLVVLAIPTAIAVNILRIVGTAVVAEQDPALAQGFYHSFSGWLVFLLGFAALYLLALALKAVSGDPGDSRAF